MSEVRPLTHADLPELARLFAHTFRQGAGEPGPTFVRHLGDHYLDGPLTAPDIRPLVHLDDDGRLTGFIGVNTLPMRCGDRPIRAAVCGALTVENHAADPMAGARLMRSFLAGPQDLSLSETSIEVSVAMWTRLGGLVLPAYSMDWIRILRPASFVVDRCTARCRAASLLRLPARLADRILGRFAGVHGSRWSGLGEPPAAASAPLAVEIDRAEFAACFARLTRRFTLRPDYDAVQLDRVVGEAARLEKNGPAAFLAVRTHGGETIGAAIFHLRPGAVARVLQVVAAERWTGPVLDALFAELRRRGAVGVIGRSQPMLTEAMLSRHVAFLPFVATVAHAHAPDLLEAIRDGDAFFNGLVGEKWMRLVEEPLT